MMLGAIIDAIGVLGIAMLSYGLWLISPVHMYVIIGTMLIAFALAASRGTLTIRRSKKKQEG